MKLSGGRVVTIADASPVADAHGVMLVETIVKPLGLAEVTRALAVPLQPAPVPQIAAARAPSRASWLAVSWAFITNPKEIAP